jgi:S-adenosylmethionine synthetase
MRTTLSIREENEIGVMVASNLIDHIFDECVTPLQIRNTLREIVEEIGIGHTNGHLAFVTQNRIIYKLREND